MCVCAYVGARKSIKGKHCPFKSHLLTLGSSIEIEKRTNFLPQNQQESLVIPDTFQVYYLGQEKKKGVLCFSNKVVIGKVDCNTMLPYRAELPLHLLGYLIAAIIVVSIEK